jgi:hypothetical protein
MGTLLSLTAIPTLSLDWLIALLRLANEAVLLADGAIFLYRAHRIAEKRFK